MTYPMNRHGGVRGGSYGGTWPITSRYTPLMVAAEHGRRDVIEGLITQHAAGQNIGVDHTLAWGDSAASLAFQQEHFEIAQRLHDLGSPLSAQQIAVLNAKALPHAALSIAQNPTFEVLEQSRLETRDSSQTNALSQMVSSIQDFSSVFKLKLNAKKRLFDHAIEQQDVLFKRCVAFDDLISRVQILVTKHMLSSEVLAQLSLQQIRLVELYHTLQKQLQKVAETYHMKYEGTEYTPKFDALESMAADELSDMTDLRQQLASKFEERVSALAHDLGISFEHTLSLIHDLTDYLEQMPTITKDSALILFGSTGVGKTTLFNFLNGCLYQVAENEEDGNVFREKISGIEHSEVGHGGRSKTVFPVVSEFQDKSYALIDMPGSADNRGKKDATMLSPYDLSAAVGMKCIMKRFNKIQGILVVCPDDQLTPERPPLELQEVFQQVGRMIQDKPHLAANIMLTVTKQGRRNLKQVLGRLSNIAKAFIDDGAMSTFLNTFIQDPNAENRILFMDVVSEDKREDYFARFDVLTPQQTKEYNFEEYSHRLDKLRQLLHTLGVSKRQLSQELSKCKDELDVLNSFEEQQRRNLNVMNVIPQFLPVESHGILDELTQFQNRLLSECDKTNQLNGLLHQIQHIESSLEYKKEISQKIQQLQCQEEIESDFNHRLGLLCVYQDEYPASMPDVSVRGTLFNPNRVGMVSTHQHSLQNATSLLLINDA